MTLKHDEQTEVEGIHQPFHWVWADSSERTAEAVELKHINKIGLQESNGKVYRLVDTAPTWDEIGVTQELDQTSQPTFQGLMLDVVNNAGVRFYSLRGTTNGAVSATMEDADSSEITLAPGQTLFFEAMIVYRENSQSTPYSGVFVRRGLIDIGSTVGSTALVGTVDSVYTNQDGSASVSITAGTSGGTLVITVSGVAARLLNWRALVKTVSASYNQ